MTRPKSSPILNPPALRDFRLAPLWQERERLIAAERAWTAQWFAAKYPAQHAKISGQLDLLARQIAANAQLQGLPVFMPPPPQMASEGREAA